MQKKQTKKEKKKSHFSLLYIYIFQKHKPECCDADGNRRLLSLQRRDRERDSKSLQYSITSYIYSAHTPVLNNAKRSPESPVIFFRRRRR